MGLEGISPFLRFFCVFLRLFCGNLPFFALFFAFFALWKLGNFTPTPSAPTPLRTSRKKGFCGLTPTIESLGLHNYFPKHFAVACDVKSGEFHAWLVRAILRLNSGQILNELRVPSKLRANSEQASGQIPSKHPKPSVSLSFCATNLLGWLTTGRASALGVKPTMRGTQQ